MLGLVSAISMPTTANAAAKGSLYFPGNAAVGHVNYSLAAPSDNQFTYEGWFKIDATETGEFFVFTTRESEWDSRGFSLRAYKQANGKWSFYSAGGGKTLLNANSTGYLDKETWYHFAVTREADGYFRYYANGVLYGTSSEKASISLSMGNIMYGLWLNGWMSNFRITIGSALYTSAGTKPQQNDAALTLTLGVNQTLFMTDYSNLRAVQKIGATIIDLVDLTADPWGNNSINQTVSTSLLNPFPKVTPTLSWSNVTKSYGDSSFNLTSPAISPAAAGTFTYTSATPSVISLNNTYTDSATIGVLGTSVITATFTPSDLDAYEVVTATMTITVEKATPTFSWADVTKNYGESTFTLTKPSFLTKNTAGSFAYSSATIGVISLNNTYTDSATIGTAGSSVITATFTPTDSTNYQTVTKTMTVTVSKIAQAAVSISLLPISKVVKSGFSQALSTLSSSGGSGTGSVTYTVTTITSGANCQLVNNAGVYTISAATAGTCSVVATKASDTNYLAGSASSNFVFSTPARTLSFATIAYALPYLATQQVTATASAQDGLSQVTFSGNNNTTTNPKLLLGAQAANGGVGNFFGYAASLGSYTIGQTVTFTDLRAGSTVAYTGTLNAQNAGGFGYAFYLSSISQITGSSINSTSSEWRLSGNGAITYSAGVSTACSVAASTGLVSITASTGTCSISASMPEDATYLASSTATPVTITVGKATQAAFSLSMSPTSKNGTSPFTQQLVTLSTSGGSGTGVLAYTISDITAGATCQLTNNSGVYTVSAATAGTCLVTATKPADSNYLVASDSKTFSFNSNRTLTYAAGTGGSLKSGLSAPTAGPFLTGDTFNIASGSAYERAGFNFNGWSDGTTLFAANDTYTVASANITLTAQWRQTSLFGISDADLTLVNNWNVVSGWSAGGTMGNGVDSFTVTVPANALDAGTSVKLYALSSTDLAQSKIGSGNTYILNVVVAWLKGLVVQTASSPINLKIESPTIKNGAEAYMILGDTVTVVGRATQDGVITTYFTEDPIISVVNPVVQNNNGGGGGGGGNAVVTVEKPIEVVVPVEISKPVTSKLISMSTKVYFGLNAAWINSLNIKAVKEFIAKVSATASIKEVTIQGFTQPTKVNPNPLGLSKARANSVAKLIKGLGITNKVVAVGNGNEKKNLPSSRYVLVTVTGEARS
jgi:outer membrane protein OmpA-like peptidoglycan-associated protein